MKQLEPRTVTIGENTYYIRPLPAMKAAHMSTELAAIAAPLLAGFAPLLSTVGSGQEGKALLDTDVKEIAPAIAEAFTTLSGDRLENLLRHLLIAGKNISIEMPNERVQLLTEDLVNEVFCEDVQDMFVLAFNVIRINYNGFFKKLGDRFGPLVESLMKTATPSTENTAPLT